MMEEQNGREFFEDGFRGPVYSISREAAEKECFKLPDGRVVAPVWCRNPRYILHIEDVFASEEEEAGLETAILEIIKEEEGSGQFEGDWTPLIRKIEAASAVNILYSVMLTDEEYERLVNGGFEALKERLSHRASSLLHLYPSGRYLCIDKPNLQLFRVGWCS
ncbi:MAG: hypothetical protein ABIB98_04035 [bacterium]